MIGELMRRVETGGLPAADGTVTVVPQGAGGNAAVCAFTAHHVVVADVDPGWVADLLPDGDLSAPLNPPFLTALSAKLGRWVNNIDLVAVAPPLPGEPLVALREITDRSHPRVERALRYRDDVRAWAADGGVVMLGRGLGGRWEMAVEVDDDRRGGGLGRALAGAARHLVPEDGRAVWAQIAPGNAASVRALLAAGYEPVGAEALLVEV